MTLARRVARATASRLVGFIVARPALDAFLRRQVFRFPGLAASARAAVARARNTHQTLPAVVTEEADLTDAARQILHDLAHVIEHTRQP